MRRYVLDSDGQVANTVELDDDAEWTPPEGHTLADEAYTEPDPDPDPEPDLTVALTEAIASLSDTQKETLLNALTS